MNTSNFKWIPVLELNPPASKYYIVLMNTGSIPNLKHKSGCYPAVHYWDDDQKEWCSAIYYWLDMGEVNIPVLHLTIEEVNDIVNRVEFTSSDSAIQKVMKSIPKGKYDQHYKGEPR
jgi:hypothetical protein